MGMIDIVRASLFTPTDESGENWGLPICFWGPPGIGKTYQISDLARSCNLYLEVLSPGERGEGAFGVTPVPSANNKTLQYPPPEFVLDLEDGGIVFVDEVNQCPLALQPAIMGITLGGRIGGAKLNGRVRVICAANPTEQSAGGYDFAPPVANRMGHFDWEMPQAEAWGEWLMNVGSSNKTNGTNGIDARDLERDVLARWAEPWASARASVSGFIAARSDMLHALPPQGNPALHRAWPSPRTWEMLARALTSARVHNLNVSDTEDFCAAFVGRGAASEFFEYASKLDLPKPSDILTGKVKFEYNFKRLDRVMATLASCQAYALSVEGPERSKRTSALWDILGADQMSDHLDVAFPAIKALTKANTHNYPPAQKILPKILPSLLAAGITYKDE